MKNCSTYLSSNEEYCSTYLNVTFTPLMAVWCSLNTDEA